MRGRGLGVVGDVALGLQAFDEGGFEGSRFGFISGEFEAEGC